MYDFYVFYYETSAYGEASPSAKSLCAYFDPVYLIKTVFTHNLIDIYSKYEYKEKYIVFKAIQQDRFRRYAEDEGKRLNSMNMTVASMLGALYLALFTLILI